MKKNLLMMVLFVFLAACSANALAPTPTNTLAPLTSTELQATLTLYGPETTPNVPRPYPGSLTVEMAKQGMAAVVDAPSEITGLAEVQAIITKHTQLARDAGLVFDHMAVKYAPADQRWFLVPVTSDGTIAGWLEIADPTSQSGWLYGEQPTWDSLYHPSTDKYQYGLPALHDQANHFVVGFENGFPVLIEVTSSGAPQYWNNIVEKTTMLVEGAVLPTPDVGAQILAELNAEIQPVSDLEVSGLSHGVPITVDFITSARMQDATKRGDQTFSSVEFNSEYPTDPKQAVSDATFLGLYYAWRDNDPAQKDARANITPDQFADLWRNGGDVTMQIYTYDATKEQFPYYRFRTFDPRTMSIKAIYTDWMPDKNKLISIANNPDSEAYATIFISEGIQLWIRIPTTMGIAQGPSFNPNLSYVTALVRLTWPTEYQTVPFSDHSQIGETYDPLYYHPEIFKLLIQLLGGKDVVGALTSKR